MSEHLENSESDNIILSGKELDNALNFANEDTSQVNHATSEEFDNFNNEEEVKLSDDEMDNILERADISELEAETLAVNESLSPESLDSKSEEEFFVDLPSSEEGEESEENNFLSKNADGEIVALSDYELDNILENVDESQVIDIKTDNKSKTKFTDIKKKKEKTSNKVVDLKNKLIDKKNTSTSKTKDKKKENLSQSQVKKEINFSNKKTKKIKQPTSNKKKVEKIIDAELVELFSYLDKLFESLPEDKIKDFAKSKYYDKYISIINRLGIK